MQIASHLQRGITDIYTVNIIEHVKNEEERGQATRDAPGGAAGDRLQTLLVDCNVHWLSPSRAKEISIASGRKTGRSLQRGPFESEQPKIPKILDTGDQAAINANDGTGDIRSATAGQESDR